MKSLFAPEEQGEREANYRLQCTAMLPSEETQRQREACVFQNHCLCHMHEF